MLTPDDPPKFENLPVSVALLHQRLDHFECLLNRLIEKDKSDSDNLLTIKQASELVHLSVNTLYALVGQKALPFSKKRRRLYFDKAELIAWVLSGHRKEIL